MDRVNFFHSINDMKYPELLVNFFDQLIALKHIVENTGIITVHDYDDTYIKFSINFSSTENMNYALGKINSLGGTIVIYEKPISIVVEVLTDKELNITLK